MSENFRGGSSKDWHNALKQAGHELAASLYEEPDPYKKLQALGLATPAYLAFENIKDFLNEPGNALNTLQKRGINNFYIGLRPLRNDLPKYREFSLKADEVADYVAAQIPAELQGDYLLRVAEHAQALYGATMAINTSGDIVLEMVRGEMANLATGVQTPEYQASSDPFTHIMRYSFDDVALKEQIWNTINLIPNIEIDTFRPMRLPGYYEFSLVERGKIVVPLFYDFIANPAYYPPEQASVSYIMYILQLPI